MQIVLFFALFTFLAANMMIESKELFCTETGETKSPLITYHIVLGKKGASGMKGFKEGPGGINEQELGKLESKRFVLNCIYASFYLDNCI